ncbi:3-hydroxyacyl-ACP dehydratase FabZ family protein [Shouchella patagoniensis]|uniref:3-hydroxyacyl-ACP dehydratase FabZ family protein n=1 Tax=Shouchella patagoniensis TaxID=228576 RepID=UPI00099580F5|nr:3-hydroxyacyl-ACP dehydratase FabZ family protein [Shouchella patagoniensis]
MEKKYPAPHEKLKQAAPFLFIDKIVDMSGDTIVCQKNVSYNEPYLSGHFPGEPIVPGVLLIEMAAQASLILAGQNNNGEQGGQEKGYLVENKGFRFLRKAGPGDTLLIKVTLTGGVGNFLTATANISNSDGEKVAKGSLTFYLPKEVEIYERV